MLPVPNLGGTIGKTDKACLPKKQRMFAFFLDTVFRPLTSHCHRNSCYPKTKIVTGESTSVFRLKCPQKLPL